jgi:hypothetical protein
MGMSSETLPNVASAACSALTQLTKDPDFDATIKELLSGRVKPNAEAIQGLLSDIKQLNEFIVIEEKNLGSLGLEPLSTLQALGAATSEHRRINPREINAEQVEADVARLRDAACRLSKEAVDAQQANQIRYGMLGAALLVGDAVGEIVSGGSMSIVAGASAAAGVTMITQTAQALTK